eukprot:318400_1
MSDFYRWLTTDPLSKLNIIFFLISILVPFIIGFCYFILHESSSAYIISGLWGISFSLYAMKRFRKLISLKAKVDTYNGLNSKFRNERNELNHQLKFLKQGVDGLQTTHDRLHLSNLKMVDMIKQFQTLEDEMNTLNIKNNQQITKIGQTADKLRSKYYDISLQQQRGILWKLFDRMEGRNKKGITENDFKQFYKLVPKEYKDRFDRLGGYPEMLKMSSRSHKNYIDARDFGRALSVYARMHVENVDLVFKLDDIKEQNELSEMDEIQEQPMLLRGSNFTILEKRECDGFYLSKDALWADSLKKNTKL